MTGTFDSQGTGKNVRAKASLNQKIDKDSVPGHWIWTADVSPVFQHPVMRSAAGGWTPASLVVYHAWRGAVRPPSLDRQCEHHLCVRPACWSAQ